MNQMYRLVWRDACGAFVAVADFARGRGKAGASLVCAAAAVITSAHAAGVNPQVIEGRATVDVAGATTTVNQSTSAVRIHWDSLGVAAGEVLKFVQPSAQAVALNLVTGSSATQVFGQIQANGQVFLLNPNGVVFGVGSEVSVGSLVAGTFKVDSFNLATGEVVLSRNGSEAAVINAGTLKVGANGQVVLVGADVRNEATGRIETAGGAQSGIFLLAGDRVEFKRVEGSPLSYQVTSAGQPVRVSNAGELIALGGQVVLEGRSAMSAVVNTTGIIEAGTVATSTSGTVRLVAGGAGGEIDIDGVVDSGVAGTRRAELNEGGTLRAAVLFSREGTVDNAYSEPPVTGWLSGVDKTYDGTRDAAVAFNLSKLQQGQNHYWQVETAKFSSANAGTRTVTASVFGESSSSWRYAKPLSLSAQIARKEISVLVDTKTYDGQRTATVRYDASDILDADKAAVYAYVADGRFVDANAADRIAVSYTRELSGGLASMNYVLGRAYGTITPATLTVTAANAAKTYDGLAFAGGNGVTYSGFVNGEGVGVLEGTLVYGGTSKDAKDAGTYLISASGLAAKNYTLNYVDGTLTIGKAALTVTAKDASKTYDGLAFEGGNGVSYSGFVNGETTAVLDGTLTYVGSAQGAKDAGTYGITASGLSAKNYDLSYVDGTLTIGKAALTVTAQDASRTYNGLAFEGGNGVSYSGFVNGETKDVLEGTLAYGGSAQGAKDAGTYGITASGLSAKNYVLTYASGTLTIDPAALIIRANDLTKVQDNVPFFGGNGVTATGLAATDTLASLTGTLVYGGTSQGAVLPGSTTIVASGLASSNYAITYEAGQLTILPVNILPPDTNPPTAIDPLAGLEPTAAGEQEDDKKIRTRVRKDNSPIRDENGAVRLPPTLQ